VPRFREVPESAQPSTRTRELHAFGAGKVVVWWSGPTASRLDYQVQVDNGTPYSTGNNYYVLTPGSGSHAYRVRKLYDWGGTSNWGVAVPAP
jgi:hypothetical protein